MGEERPSKLVAMPPPATLTPEQWARQAAANGLHQFDRLMDLVRGGIAEYEDHKFRLRPSTLVALDCAAVERSAGGPAHFRRGPIAIHGANHQPPDAQDVPRHVDEMCEYVNDSWSRSAVHLAAYVMWRLNWTQAFEDGNGRISRAASYLVLCVRLRTVLPGTPTIPELIAANRAPYYEALEAADAANATGTTDVSMMETLLRDLLMQQLAAAAASQQSRTLSATPPRHQSTSVAAPSSSVASVSTGADAPISTKAPMAQIKIYVESSGDDAGDLRRLGRIRHALWQQSLVEGSPMGAHRGEDGRLFFRFMGDMERVRAAVDSKYGVIVEEIRRSDADECVNCGNRPGDPFPTVCPNCSFRDISACPNCEVEVPRQSYADVAGNLFRCPNCTAHVRMELNPNLFDSSGHLRAPAVILRLERA